MICIASGSIFGLCSYYGIVGSSYVIVSAAKWVMTYVSGNGPVYGEKSWYQFMFGITTIVMLFGSSLVASLAIELLVELLLRCMIEHILCLSICIRRQYQVIQRFCLLQRGSKIQRYV